MKIKLPLNIKDDNIKQDTISWEEWMTSTTEIVHHHVVPFDTSCRIAAMTVFDDPIDRMMLDAIFRSEEVIFMECDWKPNAFSERNKTQCSCSFPVHVSIVFVNYSKKIIQ